LDEIVWLVFQVLGEFLLEVFGELVLGGLGELADGLDRSTQEALWSAFLCFVAGVALGLLSAVALPRRVLPTPRTPGLSLLFSPLASGLVMREWGAHRREGGHATSGLATFWGGASFALGAALGRFVMVT
jgi:hypothetical protein